MGTPSVLLVLSALVVALFGTAPAAVAGKGGGTYYYSSGCSGYAARAVYSPGASFLATDGCVDGHSAVTQWKIGSSPTVTSLWAHGGAGDTQAAANSYGSATDVHLRACTGEYGSRSIVSCSSWISV